MFHQECVIAFVYADSGEASTMRKKVEARGKAEARQSHISFSVVLV